MAVARQRKQIYAFSFSWQLPSYDAPTHFFFFKRHHFFLDSMYHLHGVRSGVPFMLGRCQPISCPHIHSCNERGFFPSPMGILQPLKGIYHQGSMAPVASSSMHLAPCQKASFPACRQILSMASCICSVWDGAMYL